MTEEPKLVIPLSDPRIKNHKKCVRPGVQGWRPDGTIVPCSCVRRVLEKEWPKLFGTHVVKQIKTVKFTEESVIVN